MIDARAVALQGVGFSPELVALQGFGEVVVVQERAGGARLQAVQAGKAWVRGTQSVTRSGRVVPVVAPVEIVLPTLPAEAFCVGGRSHTAVGRATPRAAAESVAVGRATHTRAAFSAAQGAAAITAVSCTHPTSAGSAYLEGAAAVRVRGTLCTTTGGSARATGVRRLTRAKLAAIVAVVDTH